MTTNIRNTPHTRDRQQAHGLGLSNPAARVFIFERPTRQ